MPTLISDNAIVDDAWTLFEETPESIEPNSIVPLEDASSATAISPIGVWVDGDAEAEEVGPKVTGLDLVAIKFPGFADGRGLSLATLLRTRFGFKGDIRAIGEVLPDFTPYMRRSGFTSFVLDGARDAEVAIACMQRMSDHYQGSVIQPAPAFRRRS